MPQGAGTGGGAASAGRWESPSVPRALQCPGRAGARPCRVSSRADAALGAVLPSAGLGLVGLGGLGGFSSPGVSECPGLGPLIPRGAEPLYFQHKPIPERHRAPGTGSGVPRASPAAVCGCRAPFDQTRRSFDRTRRGCRVSVRERRARGGRQAAVPAAAFDRRRCQWITRGAGWEAVTLAQLRGLQPPAQPEEEE